MGQADEGRTHRTRAGRSIEGRFETIGWGLLFLLLAALALPSGQSEYAAVLVVGGLILLLNAARAYAGVPASWFGTLLGAWAVLAGGTALLGFETDGIALFFAVFGLALIAEAARPERHASQGATSS